MGEHYAVLFNPDRWRTFVEKLPGSLTHVFVVTDSASEFANVAAELPRRRRSGSALRELPVDIRDQHRGGGLMRFELFDYQREAAVGCLDRLKPGPPRPDRWLPVVVRAVCDHRVGQDGDCHSGDRGNVSRVR